MTLTWKVLWIKPGEVWGSVSPGGGFPPILRTLPHQYQEVKMEKNQKQVCVICGKVDHKNQETVKVKGGVAYLDCLRS